MSILIFSAMSLLPEQVVARYGSPSFLARFPGESYLVAAIPLLYIASIAVTFVWMVNAMTFLAPGRAGQLAKNGSQIGIWLPYAFAWALSSVFGAVSGAATYAWVSLAIVVGVALMGASTGPRSGFVPVAIGLSRTLVAWSLVTALVSSGRAYAPYSVWPGGWWEGLDRLQGIFPHPNTLSWIAALACVIDIFAGKRFKFPFIALALLALVQSGSRTASIALALGLLAALAVRVSRARPLTRRTMTIIEVLIGVILFAYAAYSGFSLGTANGRAATWGEALATFVQFPIAGSGPGAYLQPELLGTTLGYAHNQVLQTLSELGTIGLLALIAHSAYLIRFVRNHTDQYFGIALLTMWFTMFLSENALRFASTNFVLQIVLFQLALFAAAGTKTSGQGLRPPSPLTWRARPLS